MYAYEFGANTDKHAIENELYAIYDDPFISSEPRYIILFLYVASMYNIVLIDKIENYCLKYINMIETSAIFSDENCQILKDFYKFLILGLCNQPSDIKLEDIIRYVQENINFIGEPVIALCEIYKISVMLNVDLSYLEPLADIIQDITDSQQNNLFYSYSNNFTPTFESNYVITHMLDRTRTL